ncbi:ABC transporter ATP-binding protein [Paenibacillus sepulcri]|uniref:ABC transporter ATP-binding protein n=1 Tax=Paenibacillus sepulcri TaxID=359917 RepID=A0ABS7C6Y9_9BACL|nr:ABC transporter ATP-binding protein [Paenibacillus sepulcri]
MTAVEFRQFSKRNGDFGISELSFHVETGYITGLIGPNGAGKTTLIRSMMNLVRPDQGEVRMFGLMYKEHEREIKRKIGFVYDEDFFYNHLKVHEMKKIAAAFYPTWNDALFHRYMQQFGIPEGRKVRELSKGMRTKFALAVALSHEPELLIMDEPTSGLDPVFRREVLGLLSEYIGDGKRSVLFSTHISSDLERIADYIVYVQGGKLQFSGAKEDLLDCYVLVKGPLELLHSEKLDVIGLQKNALGFEGLLAKGRYSTDFMLQNHCMVEQPSLDDIMVYTREVR